MAHYSIRKKVRDARKKIKSNNNKNNFKYITKVTHNVIDEQTGSVSKCSEIIYNHGNIPVAEKNVQKDYLDSFENHNGGFKQPQSVKFSQEKYILKKMTQMDYLRGYAKHKMKKWDIKNPAPDVSFKREDDKVRILNEHNQTRKNIYSYICSYLLWLYNNNRKNTYYRVHIYGIKDYSFGQFLIHYNKCFNSLKTAVKAYISNTLKYKFTKSGLPNCEFTRSTLYETTDKDESFWVFPKKVKMLDYHSFRHTGVILRDTHVHPVLLIHNKPNSVINNKDIKNDLEEASKSLAIAA